MAYEQNDMNGALFTNDKRGNERAPDYSGNCKINGEELRIAAWIKKDRNGNNYMSLAFSEPFNKSANADQRPSYEDQAGGGPTADPLNDEIPF